MKTYFVKIDSIREGKMFNNVLEVTEFLLDAVLESNYVDVFAHKLYISRTKKVLDQRKAIYNDETIKIITELQENWGFEFFCDEYLEKEIIEFLEKFTKCDFGMLAGMRIILGEVEITYVDCSIRPE